MAVRDVPFCIAPEQPVSVQTPARSSITVRRCAPETLPATDLSLGRFSNQKLFLSDSKALMAPLCVSIFGLSSQFTCAPIKQGRCFTPNSKSLCEPVTDLAPRMTARPRSTWTLWKGAWWLREGFYSLHVSDNFQPIHREDRNTVRRAHRVPGWGGWQAPRWIELAARSWCYYSQAWFPGKFNSFLIPDKIKNSSR